jgi:fumarate hydratase subunit alpha
MNYADIERGLVKLITKAETEIPRDVVIALKQALKKEQGAAKLQIELILKNIELAKKSGRPLCQDTGIQTFFVTIGAQFPAIGKIQELIEKSVERATKEIPLRPNSVDCITGVNNGDNRGLNIPYIIWEFKKGSDVRIIALPKGSGSENMSALGMLNPQAGLNGVKAFVLECAQQAGGRSCPPIVIGVGIGGGADLALTLGKRALLRPVGRRHPKKQIAVLETEILQQVNKTGIGPMGLGGKTTALDVHVEIAHRHPASLPVGVVIQCWADRRASMTIHKDGSWVVR